MTEAPAPLDLAALAGHDFVELGARVRRCAEDRAAPFDELARAITDAVWTALSGGTGRSLALVQLYRADARSLVLAAVRGIEPALDDFERADHRVLPLSDPEALARTPLWAQLAAELALLTPPASAPAPRDFSAGATSFVAEAIGSSLLPDQREFVLRYGVRAVVGCGGALPGGAGFALAIFARVPLTAESAAGFGSLGVHAGLALCRATDLGAPPLELFAARERAMERLLRLQEHVLLRRTTALARDADEQRRRADFLEQALVTQVGAGAQLRERTQRAMLNVIEDLREARRALEDRVVQRTRELERSNTELRSSNAELEQFAYIASHDLQEPLRTIAGYLQLLQERHGDHLDADGHEFISYAIGGARRLQELIDALLTYSRVARAPVEMAPVSLGRALDEALRGLARAVQESSAEIERDPLPVVRGDLVLLRQLFQNLVSNAIKFAGPRPPRIEVRARTGEHGVDLTVRDHGIGFDAKYAEQVFRVFRRLQRKLPGTGIGLAICKKIVERHGGTIHAESAPGQGASFHMRLPALEVAT